MVLVMMGLLEVLVPFLIKDRLGGGPGDHAWVLAAFVIGVLWSAPMVIWGTLLQRRVPPTCSAGPVSDAIGLRATFTLAGLVPVVVAVVAVVAGRLPADELAHPLRSGPAPQREPVAV